MIRQPTQQTHRRGQQPRPLLHPRGQAIRCPRRQIHQRERIGSAGDAAGANIRHQAADPGQEQNQGHTKSRHKGAKTQKMCHSCYSFSVWQTPASVLPSSSPEYSVSATVLASVPTSISSEPLVRCSLYRLATTDSGRTSPS